MTGDGGLVGDVGVDRGNAKRQEGTGRHSRGIGLLGMDVWKGQRLGLK